MPFHLIAELLPGWAYLGFHASSDPQFRDRAFLAHLLATATWAGGKTVAVV